MEAPTSFPSITITIFQLILIITTPCHALTLANCGPKLMPLAPCGPFVQGMAISPAPPCCQNLNQLYTDQPECLCLLLNQTTLTTLPLNRTLALSLPRLCNTQHVASTCSGSILAPTPHSPISDAANITPSTVAPMVQAVPQQSIMGFRFGQSSSAAGLKKATSAFMTVATTYLFI